jgi:hypothetical protein
MKQHYYYLEFKDKRLFKGEVDSDFTNFGFGFLYDNKTKLNKLEINGTFDMNIDLFDYNYRIDYENSTTVLNSKDKENLLSWSIKYNSYTKSKNFLDKCRTTFSDIFNTLDFESFYEIRRPFKTLLKKLLYNKIRLIEELFIQLENSLVQLDAILYERFKVMKGKFETYKAKLPAKVDERVDLKEIDSNIRQNIISYADSVKELLVSVVKEIQACIARCFDNTDLIEKQAFSFLFDGEKYKYISDNDELFILKNQQILKYSFSDNSIEYTTGPFSLTKSKKVTFKTGPMLYYIDIEGKSTYVSEYITTKTGFGIEIQDNFLHNHFYIGDFKDNQYNNFGIYSSQNYIYCGDYVNNSKEGNCLTQSKKDGSLYQGAITANTFQGFGQYIYPKNGIHTTYEGEFKNNMIDGKGTLVFENGDKYAGEFLENLKHGEGLYLSAENSAKLKYKGDEEIIEESVYKY